MNDEAARRRKLIEATIATLAEVGFPAASLSEIARRAQVSTGLFAHYFGDKDGLLEATLRFMAARLSAKLARRLRDAATPQERLYAVCDAALADEEFDRPTGAVWLAFWAQVAHSPRYQRVQRLYERRTISNLRHALRGLVGQNSRETVAALIAAAIDGVWLRGRAAGPGDGAAARGLLRALIDGLLASPRFAAPAHVRPPPALRAAPDVWRDHGPAERAALLRRGAGALRDAAPGLASRESAETGRPLAATAADAQECARAFEAAAAFAEGLRRTCVDLGRGRVEEREAGPGRENEIAAHWSRPLLDLGRAAFALAQGDAVRLIADPHAAKVLEEARAALRRAGSPEAALACETRPFPPDPDARFGYAGPKSALIVLPGADIARAAHAALHGGRAWSGSSFASQSLAYVHEAALAGFWDACAAAERPQGRALSPAHAAWIAQMTGGAPARVARGPDAALARAHLFAPFVPVVVFAADDDLVATLATTRLPAALGVFGGDPERLRRLLATLGPALAYVNDDGPLLWPPPDFDATPMRRQFWGGTGR